MRRNQLTPATTKINSSRPTVTHDIKPVAKRQIVSTRPIKANAAAVREIPINSVSELITELEKLNYVSNGLWYRGTGNSKFALLPSLFRNSRAQNQGALKQLEHDLNEAFRIRSVPYTDNSISHGSDWERLFFMQHYRVPTRLLDWSGSPLVSLHFAVTSVKIDSRGEPDSDVAVWALNPSEWNNAAYADTGFPGGILSARDTWLKRYEPGEVYTQAGSIPAVALRGTHNSPRIVAQQGYFTVFGPKPEPMEKAYATEISKYPKDCLVKFTVPKSSVVKVRNEVFALGISESTIYPDLEGLSAELKRLHGF